jgi:hypothetical protein
MIPIKAAGMMDTYGQGYKFLGAVIYFFWRNKLERCVLGYTSTLIYSLGIG